MLAYLIVISQFYWVTPDLISCNCSPLAGEINALNSGETATAINHTPMSTKETTVYIDKTTIREVVVERVTEEIQVNVGSQNDAILKFFWFINIEYGSL